MQAWFAATESNYGVIVKDASEGSTSSPTASFATRENTGTDVNFNPPRALRPRLVVSYTPPDFQVTSFAVDPSVFSGDVVTVSMTVLNNGATAITDMSAPAPTLTGGSTAALQTPPGCVAATVPSSTLAAAASATFTWSCTLTGSQNQTYQFTTTGATGTTNSVSVSTRCRSRRPKCSRSARTSS